MAQTSVAKHRIEDFVADLHKIAWSSCFVSIRCSRTRARPSERLLGVGERARRIPHSSSVGNVLRVIPDYSVAAVAGNGLKRSSADLGSLMRQFRLSSALLLRGRAPFRTPFPHFRA
jgi:hypothetical protein